MDWLIYALLSALFAGLVAVFGKLGVRDVDSTLATTVRAVVMALALAGLVLAKSAGGGIYASHLRLIAARAWLYMMLAGLAGAASWLCYFRALQLGDASRVAPVDRLSVLVVMIAGVLFLGEHLTVAGAIGGVLVLAGSILISVG